MARVRRFCCGLAYQLWFFVPFDWELSNWLLPYASEYAMTEGVGDGKG